MKNIHDTVIMPHDSQCQSQTQDSLTSFNVKLSWQRHWQVMMYWFMSRYLKPCHICIQNVII